jgi:hypothetical protein
MSSSILNKRIIVDLSAEVNPATQRLEPNNDELDDSLPPVKKPFLASVPNAVIEEIVSDDEFAHDASSLICASVCATAQTAVVQSEINDDSGEKKSKSKPTKLWMKAGGAKREPRVGSDFQALIE